MSDGPADFLLARIAEDEEMARAWVGRGRDLPWLPGYGPWSLEHLDDSSLDVLGIHPARVLAECEAKRRIVALHDDGYGHDGCACDHCLTLRILATPYSDHPDCKKEWLP